MFLHCPIWCKDLSSDRIQINVLKEYIESRLIEQKIFGRPRHGTIVSYVEKPSPIISGKNYLFGLLVVGSLSSILEALSIINNDKEIELLRASIYPIDLDRRNAKLIVFLASQDKRKIWELTDKLVSVNEIPIVEIIKTPKRNKPIIDVWSYPPVVGEEVLSSIPNKLLNRILDKIDEKELGKTLGEYFVKVLKNSNDLFTCLDLIEVLGYGLVRNIRKEKKETIAEIRSLSKLDEKYCAFLSSIIGKILNVNTSFSLEHDKCIIRIPS